jgi:hypothetical protein
MAQLAVDRFDAEAGRLPPVCLRCGCPSTTVRYRTFTRYPWQTSALALVRVRYEPARHRVRAGIPLCAAHRNHWRWAAVLWWLPVVLFIPICGLEVAALATALGEDFGGPFLVAVCANVALWVAWLIWLHRQVIRVVRVDEATVVFGNVSAEVVGRWRAAERDPRGVGRTGEPGTASDRGGR